jgi:hypothetical protein
MEPAIAGAAVELDAAALVAVIGVRVGAALVIGREPDGLVRHAVLVEVDEAFLPTVGLRQPAEEVVERPVLHHHDDDVLDAGILGRRKPLRVRGRREQRGDDECGGERRRGAARDRVEFHGAFRGPACVHDLAATGARSGTTTFLAAAPATGARSGQIACRGSRRRAHPKLEDAVELQLDERSSHGAGERDPAWVTVRSRCGRCAQASGSRRPSGAPVPPSTLAFRRMPDRPSFQQSQSSNGHRLVVR